MHRSLWLAVMLIGLAAAPWLVAQAPPARYPLYITAGDDALISDGWPALLLTTAQQAALAGSHGTPGVGNVYLTQAGVNVPLGVAGLDDSGQLESPGSVAASFVLTGAGAPAAGSCPHATATYRDTVTTGNVYVCYGSGENWHLIGESDGYRVPDSVATCSSAISGTPRYRVNAANVSDQWQVCTKLPDGNYYWVGDPIVIWSGTVSNSVCESTPVDTFLWVNTTTNAEALVSIPSPAGYYTRLRSRTQISIPSGQTMTVTFRKGTCGSLADTALACSQSNAQSCSNNAVVSVADGECVSQIERCTTGGAATHLGTSVVFYPTW
jgi:hypothetical protein